MSLAYTPDRLRLPESLEDQLHDFRRLVWTIKIVEAVAAAGFGILVAYLVLFGLDRVVGHAGLRCASAFSSRPRRRAPTSRSSCTAGSGGIGGSSSSPGCCRGSIRGSATSCWGSSSWCTTNSSRRGRRRCARRRSARSPATPSGVDFRDAVPNPRHRLWLCARGRSAGGLRLCLLALFPAAAANAWQRFLAPWGSTPRYTFTVLEQAARPIGRRPRRAVFARLEAHGQDGLAAQARGRPAGRPAPGDAPSWSRAATISSCRRRSTRASCTSRSATRRSSVRIEPTLRPELTSIVASVALPAYLGHPAAADRRTCAAGRSRWSREARRRSPPRPAASSATAQVDGQSVAPAGAAVSSPPAMIEGSRKIEFRWQDKLGLAGKEPFALAITGREDEAPSLSCEDLPRQKVVLDTEQLELQGPGPG